MLHARRHIEAHEAFRIRRAQSGHHAVVVIDGVEGRDAGIVPAVVEDELAAAGAEAAQVGVDGVERLPGFLIGGARRGGGAGGECVPGRVVEDHVAEIVLQVERAGASAGGGSQDPIPPATPAGLASGHNPGEELAPRIQAFERGHLGRGQAIARFHILTEEHGGVEVAPRGVVDDPVLDAILRVAGRQHGGIDGGDLDARDIRGGVAAI